MTETERVSGEDLVKRRAKLRKARLGRLKSLGAGFKDAQSIAIDDEAWLTCRAIRQFKTLTGTGDQYDF